jgi:hypothetical protein
MVNGLRSGEVNLDCREHQPVSGPWSAAGKGRASRPHEDGTLEYLGVRSHLIEEAEPFNDPVADVRRHLP